MTSCKIIGREHELEILSAAVDAAAAELLTRDEVRIQFADLLRALGYTVEPGPASTRLDAPLALDIVVREL
jgi:hypothetical protein